MNPLTTETPAENWHDTITQSQPRIPSQRTPPYRTIQPWDDEPRTLCMFVCRLCKKTFYNANALQNHRNTQHDGGEASNSETEFQIPTYYDDQNYISSFKFFPDLSIDTSSDTVHDGLTTRMFSQNTTYIIVKVDGGIGNGSGDNCPDILGLSGTDAGIKPIDLRGPFTCTCPMPLQPNLQCRQIFFNCCDYSLHYREEHTKRRRAALRCQVCEKRLDRDFNPNETLANQQQTASQVTFSCRMCGQTFFDSFQYDEHNRIIHAKMKRHQCPLCAKRFTQQGGLQQHMRMHSGIRPFACTFCPKAFTQKAGLDQHLRTHTKVKPFRCVICSKRFSQSVHLRQHMRTHTNIQPFVCSVCGRKFKQSSHLNFHMRSHVTDGTMPMESYAQVIEEQNHLDYLNLANLQPVQNGDTMYYAAEIAPNPIPPIRPNPNRCAYSISIDL